jgi:hypothetical protein
MTIVSCFQNMFFSCCKQMVSVSNTPVSTSVAQTSNKHRSRRDIQSCQLHGPRSEKLHTRGNMRSAGYRVPLHVAAPSPRGNSFEAPSQSAECRPSVLFPFDVLADKTTSATSYSSHTHLTNLELTPHTWFVPGYLRRGPRLLLE